MSIRMFSIFVLYFVAIISCFQKPAKEIDYFDFKNEKSITELGVYSIDYFLEDKIIFNKKHGDIRDKTLYDNRVNELNFDGTYKLTNINNSLEIYSFKFGFHGFDSRTILTYVNWISETPIIESGGEFRIEVVKVPFVQHGKIKVCTIGDSQTWWGHAGKLREELNKLNENLLFVGSSQDPFGYPHDGEGGNNTKQVLNRISKIPDADYYTLLLGTNDFKGDIVNSERNILEITNTLLKKFPQSKILYITPLTTTNKERDEFNTNLKNVLISKFNTNDRIDIIDVRAVYKNNIDWAERYLTEDGLHQNKEGVKIMAKVINQYFE